MFKNITIKKLLKELIFIGITLFIAMNLISYLRSPKLSTTALPEISSPLIDKRMFSTHESPDKPLLVHFWATWCPTCKLEAGNIQMISEHFNVITIAVKSGSDTEISNYLKENNFNFKVINDDKGIYASQFFIPAYPTTFIYNSDKDLEFSEVGYSSTLGLYLRMLWAQ
ncbi:MAG: redoxin domain-containing protein [Campylobacterota bacterium]|nr:redoxin domain-containing protein [Campylobacterota bacterium]